MRVMLSLNEEAKNYKNPDKCKGNYFSSLNLIQRFEERGHDVYTVPPTAVYEKDGNIFSEVQYKVKNGLFVPVEENTLVQGDAFLIRSLGQDANDPKKSKKFIDYLAGIENQVVWAPNGAKATNYAFKPNQKKLDLPFIPEYKIEDKSQLVKLLQEGEEIIAKPHVGHFGVGIEYLKGEDSAKIISDDKLGNYCYEKFIPEQIEKRYVFMGGEIVAKRGAHRTGNPGREKYGDKWLLKDEEILELDYAKKAAKLTGMYYGSADFRGGYLLEINGSGTSTKSTNFAGKVLYDFAPTLVRKIEEGVEKRK